MRPGFVLSGLALSLLSACSGEPSSAPASASEALSTSHEAFSLLSSLRQRFVLPAPTLPARPGLDAPAQGSPRPLLGESHAERWSVRDGWLRPELPDHRRRGITRPASVRLPVRASGAFELTDETSGMRVSVTRVGALAAEAEQAEGWAVYRGGLGAGADVLHRATAEGTEDFVHFASKPEREELRYRVDVSGVAGLRLVSNVLEFVNSAGDPRLRVTAPMLVDGAGERRELKVGVEGCAYSSDPAPPWGKAVVGPGASECEVVVRWEAGARYPLVVDPNWTASGNLSYPRTSHTASELPDGRVLIVGGNGEPASSMAEIWANGTFAAGGVLAQPRSGHTASTLPDGRVLVVGGGASATSSEVWSNGLWTPSGNTKEQRSQHTASVLPDGRVLVVGGALSQQTSEVYKEGVFSSSGGLVALRWEHTASVLPDGRVLVAGGWYSPQSSEVWDQGVWTSSGNLLQPRNKHVASTLKDGRVFVVGGDQSLKTSEVWLNNSWTAGSELQNPHQGGSASVLPGGLVLLVGGGGSLQTSELWNNGVLAPAGSLSKPRRGHTASVLPDGRVLVVGGDGGGSSEAAQTSEVWSENKPAGQPCLFASQCASGFCSDGVCCDAACSGECQACSAAKKGQGADGNCGFVVTGVDPDNECAVIGAGSCQSTGACNGAGQCDSKAGNACAQAACSLDGKTQIHAVACDTAGQCPAATTSCFPFVCQGTACLSICTKDGDCQEGYFCQGGTCAATADQGKACALNNECGSGFCVDSVCCNTVCSGDCEACSAAKKGQGVDGLCGPIKADLDPDNECSITGSGTCQSTGACDGKGACSTKQGVECEAQACSPDSKLQLLPATCGGAGLCGKPESVDCYPFVCQGTACLEACAKDSDCQGGFCQSGECKAAADQGKVCSKNSECGLGFCVDGFCCNEACTGDCRACSKAKKGYGLDGVCQNTKLGEDPDDECQDNDAPSCLFTGKCDGQGACQFYGEAIEAKPAACASIDTSQPAWHCDGLGGTVKPSPISCAPFTCNDATGGCKTKCQSDKDCATGAVCAANGQCTLGEASCADEHTARGADGKLTKCDPYTCLNGQCRSTCATDLECSEGFACQGDKCVPEGAGGSGGQGAAGNGTAGSGTAGSGTAGSVAAGKGGSGAGGPGGAGQGGASGGAGGSGAAAEAPAEDSACGCRAVGSSSPSGAGALGLLALVATARRRRARG